jgi:hypothetical protein
LNTAGELCPHDFEVQSLGAHEVLPQPSTFSLQHNSSENPEYLEVMKDEDTARTKPLFHDTSLPSSLQAFFIFPFPLSTHPTENSDNFSLLSRASKFLQKYVLLRYH